MKRLLKIEEQLSVALFLLTFIVLLWQIFSRKVLNSPSSWSEELARLLFVYMGVLGAHLAQNNKMHVRIDFIFSALPKIIQFIFRAVLKLIMSVVFIWIAIIGMRMCAKSGVQDKLVTLALPVSVLHFSLIVLGVLLALELIVQVVLEIRAHTTEA